MNDDKMGLCACGVIWFGAAVSVAEIEAGIQSGPNALALILGHLLGGGLLFAVGLIGAFSQQNAMETTTDCFGKRRSAFFAALNLLQLVGWTAVMLAQAALLLNSIQLPLSKTATVAILAALIAVGLGAGLKNSAKVETVLMVLLAIFFGILAYKLCGVAAGAAASGGAASAGAGAGAGAPLGFWDAFEVSIAMPLSWLPLISDYTQCARRPIAGTAVSALVYTAVSICMFALGMRISVLGADLAGAIALVDLGWPGCLIVGCSTLAVTYLDAHSAGESAKALWHKISPKIAGIAACALGAVLALSGIIDRYTNFLYLIASVFAPMAAVLLVSHYLVRPSRFWWNFAAWASGFAVYQLSSPSLFSPTAILNSPAGPSLTALLTAALVALAQKPFTHRQA